MDIGYLSSWDLDRTARGADFKLKLAPGKRLLSLPNFAAVVNPDARAVLEAGLPAWVGELIERGVVERKARQLALDIADDQPVSDQIEYAEHLIQQDRRGRGKIANPAGFLVWAIENNLSVPPDFETTRKRAASAKPMRKPPTISVSVSCSSKMSTMRTQTNRFRNIWIATTPPSGSMRLCATI